MPAVQPLPDPAKIAVIGGGPAGAFFAIAALRRAKQLGRTLEVLVFEKKPEGRPSPGPSRLVYREGCNHCAGGVSPRLIDVLEREGLSLPDELVASRIQSLAIHGDWKSIELPVPEGRKMLAVFRGSRPQSRPDRHYSFDSFLLARAIQEGAQVITADVRNLDYSDAGRPVVTWLVDTPTGRREDRMEADFAAVAAGVNWSSCEWLPASALVVALQKMIPRFRPPRVRRTLICELQTEEQMLRAIQGEVHFAQYGSRDLRIEMSSLIPKGQYLTVALVGRQVDTAEKRTNLDIVEQFIQLPHVQRLLPAAVGFTPACLCNPQMTVGVARRPYGNRVGVIGDLAVSRLYKDGIYSAYLTASALAGAIFDAGTDAGSLKAAYWPMVRKIHVDNRYGKLVFLLSRMTFSRPVLSRILYQAVITERKSRPSDRRRLADLLWKIASGDETYLSILLAMFHPANIARVVIGGALVTARNYVIERIFGLKWGAFGRYPTAVAGEDVQAKRRQLSGVTGIDAQGRAPEMERMYTIRIQAAREAIWSQLGKFGDHCEYLRPRMIRVERTAGVANQVGSVVRYIVSVRCLGFSMVLENAVHERLLVYRILDGFPRGGVLVFDIQPAEREAYSLSIYVAFDFPRGNNPVAKVAWWLWKLVFPAFVHDVLWNHALCKLKSLVEQRDASSPPPHPVCGAGTGVRI
jgi:flavin-dependent dehydrogenase